MIWQDFVFMFGSGLSIVFLAPTLRDGNARVPLATSGPSVIIGGAYAFTFATLGMTFSATGALVTCLMWTLISFFRAPQSPYNRPQVPGSCMDRVELFVADAHRWVSRKRSRNTIDVESYVFAASDVRSHPGAEYSGGDRSC